VAVPLRSCVRPHDTAARYGCRELALILRGLTLQAAFGLVDRLRSMLASRELTVRGTGQSLGRVTISLGLTPYRAGEPLDDWVDRAGCALEAAQRSGANRTVALAAPSSDRSPAQS
jgi:diguanylate cyclase